MEVVASGAGDTAVGSVAVVVVVANGGGGLGVAVSGVSGGQAGVENSWGGVWTVLVLTQVGVAAPHNVNTRGFNGGGLGREHDAGKKRLADQIC